MKTRLSQLLQHIRSKEESVRKRWLFTMSGLTMVLVVGIWVQYIEGSIGPAEEPLRMEAAASTRVSFTAVISAGIGVVKEKSGAALSRLRGKLGAPRSIVIENPERNFIVDELTPVSGASFPKL